MTWSNGETTPSITVHESGIYTATCALACGTASLTQTVTAVAAPTASVDPPGPLGLCPGATRAHGFGRDVLPLEHQGDDDGHRRSERQAVFRDRFGRMWIGRCLGDVAPSALPTALVMPESPVLFCPGTPVTLTASGGNSYPMVQRRWRGLHHGGRCWRWTVTVSNACGSDEATVVTLAIPLPEVDIAASSSVIIRDGSIVLTAEGIGTYYWSTGASSSSMTVTAGGSHTA